MEVNAAQIRAARAGLNWSQDQLASRAGTVRKTINRIESETTTPHAATLAGIVDALEAAGVVFIEHPGGAGVLFSRPVEAGQ